MVEFTALIQRIGNPEPGEAKISGNFVGELVSTEAKKLRRVCRGAHPVGIDDVDGHRAVVKQTWMNELYLKPAVIAPQRFPGIESTVAVVVVRNGRQKVRNRLRRAIRRRCALFGYGRDTFERETIIGDG